MSERTLSIVKPDAVKKNAIGEILRRFEAAGLRIVAARMFHLSPETAGRFYVVHKERPFFKDLVKFMSSGPILVSVLEGENAIAKNREIMGPTDSTKAPAGTIRAWIGRSRYRRLGNQLLLQPGGPLLALRATVCEDTPPRSTSR